MHKYGNLISRAQKVRESAYAPYSGYKVGAAILTAEGKIFTGCNVENIAYGSTMCAERVAIYKAISEGYTHFEALALVVDSHRLGIPCGACRQVIAELAPKVALITANIEGEYKIFDFEELLPLPFSPEYLK